jgi:transcription factor TFIIIB component B''
MEPSLELTPDERSAETLSEIISVKRLDKPRKRTKVTEPTLLALSVDERRLQIIEQLFANAKENMQRLRTEQQAPVTKRESTAPKVKIENGRLVIDREEMLEACINDQKFTGTREVVQDSGNKATQWKKPHGDRWSGEETEQFFIALQLFGTDFGLIAKFMKRRARSQIKSKFKKESRLNPSAIDFAICNKISISKQAYEEFVQSLQAL